MATRVLGMSGKQRSNLLSGIAVTLAALVLWPGTARAYIYWSNFGTSGPAANAIVRDTNDGNPSTVDPNYITGANQPKGVTFDGNYLYWTNFNGNSIGRANLDGSNTMPNFIRIPGANNSAEGVAVDGNYIYWANTGLGTIGRANLDGSGVPDASFITVTGGGSFGTPWPVEVAVDGNYIYWANEHGNAIGRANLDGSNPNQSWITTSSPAGLTVDSNYIYWTEYQGAPWIGRANLDGSGVNSTFIPTGAMSPEAVAVDGTYIYWTNRFGSTIGRDTIDGNPSNINPSWVTTDANVPWGIAVGLPPSSIGLPYINGRALERQTLTESQGTYTHSPTTFNYQWLRCDAAGNNCYGIPSAVAQTYTLGPADVASTIRVREVASNPYGGFSSPVTSAQTGVVQALPPTVQFSPPSLAGPTATFTVTCRGLLGQQCAGKVIVTTRERRQAGSTIGVIASNQAKKKGRTVTVTVARASYSVPAGSGTLLLPITLNATGKGLLAKFYRLPTKTTFSGTANQIRFVTFAYPRLQTNPIVFHGFIPPCATSSGCYTTVTQLTIDGFPAGSKVFVICRGVGCSFGRKGVKPTKRQVVLTPWFAGARLAPGATIELVITAANRVGKVVVYVLHGQHAPTKSVLCLPPGYKRPAICR